MDIADVKNDIVATLRSYGASRIGLFGSATRGEMREDSDIDILVDIKKDISLLDFVEMKQKLEERLGRKVDLVEYSALKPSLKNKILQSEVALL